MVEKNTFLIYDRHDYIKGEWGRIAYEKWRDGKKEKIG